MKKIAFIFGLMLPTCALAVTTPGDSPAPSFSGFSIKPYVGADYNYYNADYTGGNSGVFARSFNGGDIHAGIRAGQYFGLEASYFDTAHSNDTYVFSGTPIKTSAKIDGWAIDAMGYVPIARFPKLELIGTAGLAHTSASGKASAIGSITLSDSETKPRIGGGAQYWFTDKLNVRALVRYQDADLGGIVNNVIIGTIGLNYQF